MEISNQIYLLNCGVHFIYYVYWGYFVLFKPILLFNTKKEYLEMILILKPKKYNQILNVFLLIKFICSDLFVCRLKMFRHIVFCSDAENIQNEIIIHFYNLESKFVQNDLSWFIVCVSEWVCEIYFVSTP